jgi:hypothetical protein
MTKRRRFKQTVPLKERLLAFANDLRKEASEMPAGQDRDALLKRARLADTAAHLDEWMDSAGFQPPGKGELMGGRHERPSDDLSNNQPKAADREGEGAV